MRKLILTALIMATALPGAAMAQSAGELRRDRQDIRHEQRDLRDAQRYGSRGDVRDARNDVRDAKREYREDWRDYRQTHRTVYARGKWQAPFRYQRFNAGATVRPAYYSSRYYLADPGRYRLPAAGQNMRWVRHYDDVLLINIRTGRVVNVHRNFFW
jgi:Ni/Co efflux regulator RcnB